MESQILYAQKLLMRAIDPNDSYTMAEFEKEFSGLQEHHLRRDGLTLKCVNLSDNEMPDYQSHEAAGFDIRAFVKEPVVIPPLKRATVPTGLYFQLPPNFEMQIRPRSGLAHKFGVTVLNSPGTIDSDYRGEIGVILINLGEEPFTVSNGDRIAQAVVSTAMGKSTFRIEKVDQLDNNTERGTGGFGSTGRN